MLPDRAQFETPENIQITYQTAGMGNRFLAWFSDEIIMFIFMLVIFIIMAFMGMSGVFERIGGLFNAQPDEQTVIMIMAGLFIILWGAGNFMYFTLFELLMNGQTIGKRSASLRVVKADGFALDFGSILIRNLFRVLDNIPLMWVVPVVSARSQRLGDMVAGTIVIVDKPGELSAVRDTLARRQKHENRYQFSLAQLSKLGPQDLSMVEQIYERARGMDAVQAMPFVQMACQSLTAKMGIEMPEPADQMRFLEDFLAAEYHRQHRALN